MLVSVTPLGSRRGDARGAAAAVLDYLDGRTSNRSGPNRGGPLQRDTPGPPTATGPAAYYADSVEGPGSWLGHGVAGLRMHGAVDPAELERLLLAQDPRT